MCRLFYFFKAPKSTNCCLIPLRLKNCFSAPELRRRVLSLQSISVIQIIRFVFYSEQNSDRVLKPSPVLHSKFCIKSESSIENLADKLRACRVNRILSICMYVCINFLELSARVQVVSRDRVIIRGSEHGGGGG